MDAVPLVHTNAVRLGYAQISSASQDHQLQLDALAAAYYQKWINQPALS